MALTATRVLEASASGADEVSLTRLYVLRATYLLLIVGLGGMIVPEIVAHPITERGIIPALLGGVWALAFLGLRYPLQMLPLLMFEFLWKVIWVVAYGLPQWSSGQLTPVTTEDLKATLFGVILMPLVIPWGYVWRRYVKQAGDRWQ
ncbi:hypothetical protein [Sphingosinicella humi]|uniref:DUF2569 domain-containing protein n=1 Tax=Allosphingosinicella humi TaxID=2068657 RepID=A0A2U2IZC3_9SPHN|nr:hypothetical protein [Sphingosinicella humi]PWG01443.1 hypothetical protein DF286_00075 [Sphingosinicella humi]